MTSIPWKLFSDLVDHKSVLNKDKSIASAVGMIFLPRFRLLSFDYLTDNCYIIRRDSTGLAEVVSKLEDVFKSNYISSSY